ncbi:MAG: helix-turn-helix domain-containing protein [bacterium]|nr:helix-turn-helix domain-containing protein [bacterium]MDD5755882.1 helix-turn-helix domain-containing protein [bacterium]
MTKEIMDLKEVASYLSFSHKKLYNLINDGKIPYTRIGGQYRFVKAIIDEFLLANSNGYHKPVVLEDSLVFAKKAPGRRKYDQANIDKLLALVAAKNGKLLKAVKPAKARPRPRKKNSQRGSIVIYLILILAFLLALIPTIARMISVSAKDTKHQLLTTAMADNIAKAGLIDTVSWFRKQMIVKGTGYYPNPDDAFYPRQASGDTEDEATGLVKTYLLNDEEQTWARYEIKRQPASPQPYDAHAVHDITDQRTNFPAGDGLVWYLESQGFIYKKVDPTKNYNEEPNRVLSKSRMSGEIRQLSMSLPVNAAVSCVQGNQVHVNSNGIIDGGTDAYGVARVGGSAAVKTGTGKIIGTPSAQVSGITSPAVDFVFGVTESELKGLADYLVNSISNVPTPYPTMSFVFVEGDLEFNSAHPLVGGGILYVNGDLTLDSTSNTLFSGLIYVTGTTTIEGPALIQGAVVSIGGMTISGLGDVAEIDFDGSILTTVRQQLAYYREDKTSLNLIPLF